MKINNKEIQVEIKNIQLGMFVSELDIPWDDSGFILQGFLVTENNIQHLKKKCQWVMVSKKRSQSGVVFVNQHLDSDYAENPTKDLTKVSGFRLTSLLRRPAKLTRKKSFFDGLVHFFSGLLGDSKPNKLAFASTVYASKDSLEFKSKQDLILAKKASKVRTKFQDDALVSKEFEQHYATASVKEEKAAALTSKKNLISTVERALSFDVANSATMNIVLNETKESVGSIVESMIRNPEAMSLVDNIRQYDNYSYKHAVDVCVLMIAFGRELHLPKNDLIELGIGGLLHDIGEVSPKEGKRSSGVKNIAMFGIYKNHVEDGLEMLKKSPYSEIVKTIIAEHHEHYDGTGYPNQLCCIDKNPRKYVNIVTKISKPISMYGCMIAIVDNYVSLTSGRSNVSPVVPSDAMSHILQKAGAQFDPALCDVFSQVVGVYPVGSYVELITNEIALVLQQNRAWRLSPVLKVLTDTNRKKVQPYLLDLMNQKSHLHRAIKKDIAFKV